MILSEVLAAQSLPCVLTVRWLLLTCFPKLLLTTPKMRRSAKRSPLPPSHTPPADLPHKAKPIPSRGRKRAHTGKELLAMAVEYGVSQFFVTFTANESGWSDLRAACEGKHHSKCPVEATRAYNRRWEAFLINYLKGKSPIGTIQRVWWRQEDQARPRHAPEPCTLRA